MTFSLAGRCPNSGRIGYAVTTSSVAVGARVGAVTEGCVVISQARTDPRLHQAGLTEFARSGDANSVLEAMRAATHAPHWRQLGVLTMQGLGLHHSGTSCSPYSGGLAGADCLAVGNFLAGERVLTEMVRGFEATTGALEDRLLAGLAAGEVAGGEVDPLQSAALVVMGADALKDTDLRIDFAAAPVRDLTVLYRDWAPKSAAYRVRAVDPDNAPDSSDVEHAGGGGQPG